MKLSLSLLGAAVALFGLASDLHAQTTPSSLVYEAVDKYRFARRTLYLTGTVQGQAAASSSQYFLLLDDVQSCERMLLTSINRPGRFLFSLEGLGGGQATCALVRRP